MYMDSEPSTCNSFCIVVVYDKLTALGDWTQWHILNIDFKLFIMPKVILKKNTTYNQQKVYNFHFLEWHSFIFLKWK